MISMLFVAMCNLMPRPHIACNNMPGRGRQQKQQQQHKTVITTLWQTDFFISAKALIKYIIPAGIQLSVAVMRWQTPNTIDIVIVIRRDRRWSQLFIVQVRAPKGFTSSLVPSAGRRAAVMTL